MPRGNLVSHFTQDLNQINSLKQYFKEQIDPVPPKEYTVQKVSGDMGIHNETYTGYSLYPPEVGNVFRIHMRGHLDFKWFRTSIITAIEITDTGYLLTTLNSVYKVDIL